MNFSTGHLMTYHRSHDRPCAFVSVQRFGSTKHPKEMMITVELGAYVLVLRSTYSRAGSGAVTGESSVLVTHADGRVRCGLMANRDLSDKFVRVK